MSIEDRKVGIHDANRRHRQRAAEPEQRIFSFHPVLRGASVDRHAEGRGAAAVCDVRQHFRRGRLAAGIGLREAQGQPCEGYRRPSLCDEDRARSRSRTSASTWPTPTNMSSTTRSTRRSSLTILSSCNRCRDSSTCIRGQSTTRSTRPYCSTSGSRSSTGSSLAI